MKKATILKILCSSVLIINTISLNTYASDSLSNSIKKLENAGIDESRITQIEEAFKRELEESDKYRSNSETIPLETIADEIIEDLELYERDPSEKEIVSKQVKTRSIWDLVAPGDIVIDHTMAQIGNTNAYLGHAAIVSENKNYVWEILGYGHVVEKNSTWNYYNNNTSVQSWNYVPSVYTDTTLLNKVATSPSSYKGKSYGLTNSKTTSDKFYCSKLVWRAWKDVAGLDLDNDGGYSVYPLDIYWDSEVQPYFQQNM